MSQQKIDAVIVYGDPLNTAQIVTNTQAAGVRSYIWPQVITFNPLVLHRIDTVISSLDY